MEAGCAEFGVSLLAGARKRNVRERKCNVSPVSTTSSTIST